MDKVLVLNADYTPLNVITFRRGFHLVSNGKAEILKSSEVPIIAGYKTFMRPLIIRLINYVKFRVKNIRVNRVRIYKRDNHTCVYCGSKKNLTIDHVIPKSKGGKNTWTNLVTCCSGCNLYKGDRTPEQAHMSMKMKPYEPSIFSDVINNSVEQIWDDFKKTFLN